MRKVSNEVKGECNVMDREGSIEAFAFSYGVEMPVDKFDGTTNGTRQHDTATLVKSFDTTSPVLFQAACNGTTLKSITIKWYRINPHGSEEEYFTHTLEDVKVVSYQQELSHAKDEANNSRYHEDIVKFRFGKITMKHHNGNIEASDTWLKRA